MEFVSEPFSFFSDASSFGFKTDVGGFSFADLAQNTGEYAFGQSGRFMLMPTERITEKLNDQIKWFQSAMHIL